MPVHLGLREGSMLDSLLPGTEKSWLLTRTGAFTEELTSDSLAQAVAGHIVAGTERALAAAAVSTPLISVDMSTFPPELLTELVEAKAALEFHGTDHISLPNLMQGDVWLTQAESVALPRLVSGAIGADVVSRLDLPMFEDGPVSCPEATHLRAPRFRTGTVYAPKLEVLDLPAHEKGHVDTRAPCVYLPRHRHGDLELNGARELVAPCHETGAVMAPEAQQVAMPRHRAGQVKAAKAKRVVIPGTPCRGW